MIGVQLRVELRLKELKLRQLGRLGILRLHDKISGCRAKFPTTRRTNLQGLEQKYANFENSLADYNRT